MQISQKKRTFAVVIELNRHIEILLLSSDCVIVPDLGGFMTHHIDARYDNEDHMFVPPLRTLGFNPQLTMNDSLLAQSYIEAYDISYPEAIRRIETEVTELKQQLSNDGFYEMNGIGILSMNEDGHIVFTPCEAGLLTPSLYGLGAFEMLPLNQTVTVSKQTATTETVTLMPTNADEESRRDHNKEHAIVIKMSWLRNFAAAAAAIMLFLLLTPPVANSDQQNIQQMGMSQVDLLLLPKKAEPKKLDTSAVITKQDTILTLPQEDVEEKPTYCLVLASQVAQQGAENLVIQMKQQGFNDTRINIHKNVRRVVFGHYNTQSAAYQALNKLRNTSSEFNEAWVYKTN